MLDGFKELTPVIYGETAIKYLYTQRTQRELVFKFHWHDRMELLYVEKGSLELHLSELVICLQEGQLAIVTPKMLHCAFSGDHGVIYHTFMFEVDRFFNKTLASSKYLLPIQSGDHTFAPYTDHPSVITPVRQLIELLNTQNNPLTVIGCLYQIMGGIVSNCALRAKTDRDLETSLQPVLKYINTYFSEPISSRDISSHFGYNEAYFCRLFKKITGLTVMNYIHILRMESAQKLLKDTSLEIQHIAWKCGYRDCCYFSNSFRKYFGYSPSEFRKM